MIFIHPSAFSKEECGLHSVVLIQSAKLKWHIGNLHKEQVL